MFSLLSLIADLFQRLPFDFLKSRFIQVRRIPATKTFRAHLWGLTMGLAFFFLAFCFDYSYLFKFNLNLTWYAPLLFLAIFIGGTVIGGPFVIFAVVFHSLPHSIPSLPAPLDAQPLFYTVFHFFIYWYLLGYVLGAVSATFYNDLLFLHVISFGKKSIKLAFAYDVKEKLHIIKSPQEREETALLEILQPIMYYVKNIDAHRDVLKSAEKLVGYIRRAYCFMTAEEQHNLKTILSGKTEKNGEGETPRPGCTWPIINGHLTPTPKDEEFNRLLLELKARFEKGDDQEVLQRVQKVESLLEKYLLLKERKLYNYQLTAPPECPYTIAMVANPFIRKFRPAPPHGKRSQSKDEYVVDPIIRDPALFFRYVDLALSSFDSNEVLGRPEIWSRVRVIVIFDEALAKKNPGEYGPVWGLLEEFQFGAQQDALHINNLLDCREHMLGNFANMLNIYQPNSPNEIKLDDIDVIFAFSAHPTHDRSMAHFSDWEYYDKPLRLPKPAGKGFTYNQDPTGKKGDEIVGGSPSRGKSEHDAFPALPGRVALNVLSARQRTFVHEFAHAMSSAVHGAIVDEYYDEFYVKNADFKKGGPSDKDKTLAPFYVNRIQRAKKPDAKTFIPVHDVFAEFNDTIFHSDMAHPSTEEHWFGYFPERHSPYVGCTMDRSYGPHRFDKLISHFMYDRIITKLNRSR